MADVFSREKRSEIMSLIRGHDNKETELELITILRRNKITGWRRKQPVFGKPDFVFYRYKAVVFVDGCFWHQCPKHSNIPHNNQEFWKKKLNANKARDTLVTKELKKQGWNVIRIWEHELKNENAVYKRLRKILDS